MGVLETYISSLEAKEKVEFKKHLDFKGKSKDRLDVKLFQILLEHGADKGDAVITRLYNLKKNEPITKNLRNSYYQWRSILTNHIEDFCIQKITQEDKVLYVFRQYLLARFLFTRRKYISGYKYLNKAVELAQKSEDFSLLCRIYALQLDYAYTQPSMDIDSLLKKMEDNERKMLIESKCTKAYNVLIFKLTRSKRKGEFLALDSLLEEAKQQFGKKDEIQVNSKAFFKFNMAVYTVLDEKLEHQKSYDLLKSAYDFLVEEDLLGAHNQRMQLELLTFMVRSAVLSNKFDEAEHYNSLITDFYRDFTEDPIINFRSHIVEFVMFAVTGRIELAYEKIYYLYNHDVARELCKEGNRYYSMLYGNLVSIHFIRKEFSQAKKFLFEMINNESRIKKRIGISAVMVLYLVELMILIELREYYVVEARIPVIKKRFKTYKANQDVVKYFELLDVFAIYTKPRRKEEALVKAIDNYLVKWPKLAMSHSEFILTQPFLKSLKNNTSYYEELLVYMK